MTLTDTRRRWLLRACFAGGIVLAVIAFTRWPMVGHVHRRGDTSHIDYRYDFARNRGATDRILAVADHVASAFFFLLGPLLFCRGAQRGSRLRDMWGKRWTGGGLTMTAIVLSFVGAFVIGSFALGAIIEIFRR